MSTSGFYNIDRVRSPQQRALYEDLDRRGICMFCHEGHSEGGITPLKRGAHWTLVRNKFPQAGTAGHFLCIYNAHVTSVSQIEIGALDEAIRLFSEQVRLEFGHENFGIGLRNGDPAHTCASIAHLHMHCFVGVKGHIGDETIIIDLGYKTKL